MCGIAGFHCFGDKRPDVGVVKELLAGIEPRGRDASGIAWLDVTTTPKSPVLQVWKAAVSASKFITKGEWKGWKPPATCIMHTRAKTQGTEKEAVNNHPVFNKSGVALVHNGMVQNYDALVKKHKWAMDGEVDTEALLKLLEKGWWKDVGKLNEVYGSFAVASINTKHPEKLVLVRHDNPLVVALDEEDDILYWASTAKAIEEAVVKKVRGLWIQKTLHFQELSNNSAQLWDRTGLRSTKFITPVTWTQYNASKSAGGYSSKGAKVCYFCKNTTPGYCGYCHRTNPGVPNRGSNTEPLVCEFCQEVVNYLRVVKGKIPAEDVAICNDCHTALEAGGSQTH